ncbi:MAG: hypothetical protein C0497_04125 [Gemmatimonas sp.]|nr:hypothetical protein [Gemmatimonas sp.]
MRRDDDGGLDGPELCEDDLEELGRRESREDAWAEMRARDDRDDVETLCATIDDLVRRRERLGRWASALRQDVLSAKVTLSRVGADVDVGALSPDALASWGAMCEALETLGRPERRDPLQAHGDHDLLSTPDPVVVSFGDRVRAAMLAVKRWASIQESPLAQCADAELTRALWVGLRESDRIVGQQHPPVPYEGRVDSRAARTRAVALTDAAGTDAVPIADPGSSMPRSR